MEESEYLSAEEPGLSSGRMGIAYRLSTIAALITTAAVLFFLRFYILSAYPYPPSADVAGDLYGLHAWLGQAQPNLLGPALTPPLYPLLVVAPFVMLFPTFVGLKVMIALVPAVIVFPAYLFLEESGMRKPWTILGAALLAGSTLFSLMSTWNSAYNLFAIFLLLFFLTLLTRALKHEGWVGALLTGISLAAIAATHELTLVMAIVTLGFSCGWYVIARRDQFRARLQRVLRIVIISAICLLPLSGLYLSYAGSSANNGVGQYFPALESLYQASWFFAWGYQGGPMPFFVLIDIILTAFGIAIFVFIPRSNREFVYVTGGAFAASLAIPFLNAANGVRGLYYLPIPFTVLLTLAVAEFSNSRTRESIAAKALSRVTRVSRTRIKRAFGGHRKQWNVAALLAMSILLVVNTSYSLQTMETGVQFYMVLNQNSVNALDWVMQNTSHNAVFFDSAGLQTWMWGYANRIDYAPEPLTYLATIQSYDAARLADLIDLGTYLSGNGQLVVGSNLPGPIGVPTIYLTTPGMWYPFLITQANQVSVTVRPPAGLTENLSLQFADVESVLDFTGAGGLVGTQFNLWFPSQAVGLTLRESVAEGTVRVSWSSNDTEVLYASCVLAMPPSGYYFNYQIPKLSRQTSVTDHFTSLEGAAMTATISGGNISQETGDSGWSVLDFQGTSLDVSTTGFYSNGNHPFNINTTYLLAALKVGYIITNYNFDYPLYTKLQTGRFGGVNVAQVFQSGPIVIYKVLNL